MQSHIKNESKSHGADQKPHQVNLAIHQQIEEIIKNNDVVLFMKGTQDFPQCGFSGAVVSILKYFKVSFKDVNVLASDEMRKGIKEYTDWPTIPQLYVKEKFIGGADIVRSMFDSGELEKLFKKYRLSS